MRLAFVVVLLAAGTAAAQVPLEPAPLLEYDSVAVAPDTVRSLDRALLYAIYRMDGSGTAATLTAVNWTSNRVFLASVPAAWLSTAAFGEEARDWRPAIRLTASAMGTTAVVYALKAGVRRPRPYAVEAGIVPRGGEEHRVSPSFSFPSGHAALSFTLATSLSLTYPEWYVIAPAMTYASLVALSRPWLGVHYPSDALAGAAIGAGAALVVHLVSDALIPESLHGAVEPMLAVPLVRVSW